MKRLPCLVPALSVGISLLAHPLSGQSSPTPRAATDSTLARGEEPSPRERWGSPFAVSSTGSVRPAEVREVTVIGADSAIAEALERRERLAETRAGRTAARSAEVEVRRDPPPDPNRPSVYRIQNGDTWYGIATRFGVSPQALERANPDTSPGRMRVGQLIEIPGGAEDSPRGIVHRVDRGETLWAIARRYDVSPERIREVNGLEEDRLRPNQTLLIPVAGRSDDGR